MNKAARTVLISNLPPPSLTARPRLTNGSFQINLAGVPGRKHAIDATTNLNPPIVWSALATNVATNGAWSFFDPGGFSRQRRFYRPREVE